MTPLRGLTARGRGLLAAGATLAGFAAVAGERDLLRVAVLLVALPLAAAASVARTRYRLSVTRTLEPGRLPVDAPATVSLRVANDSRLPTGALRLADSVPWTLGEPARFLLGRMEPGAVRELSYQLTSGLRGRFRIGPLSVRLADPFGLCELTRSFPASDVLVVTPAVTPLPPLSLPGERIGGAEGRERSLAAHGEDDAAIREYRHGDDLRRVHWRSSAHTGELMVRREERPWQRSATLLVDLRRGAHRGDGRHGSLEWAVAAGASIGAHLLAAGYRLQVVDGTPAGWSGTARDALLDRLAVAGPLPPTALQVALAQLSRAPSEGLLVAVLGGATGDELARLAALSEGRPCGIAFLLDVHAFAASGSRRAAPPGGAAVLRAAGWRVVDVAPGERLAELWPLAGATPGPRMAPARLTVAGR